jgi:hypothetical protein
MANKNVITNTGKPVFATMSYFVTTTANATMWTICYSQKLKLLIFEKGVNLEYRGNYVSVVPSRNLVIDHTPAEAIKVLLWSLAKIGI